MSKIDDLFKATDLRSVFSAPTETRVEEENVEQNNINTNDFEEEEIINHPQSVLDEEEIINHPQSVLDEEEYDPKIAAQSLVYGLQAIDQIVLAPVCYIKSVKSVGGVKAVKQMKKVLIKQVSGQVLSDQEKQQLTAFDTFKKDLAILSGEILPNEKQTKLLIERAIPYCTENQIKMGAGFGFWVSYAGQLSEKILKIIMQ